MPDSNSDRVLGWVLRSVQRFHALDEVDVPNGSYDEFVVLFGYVAQVHRFADGYLKLRAKGLGREGHALVRGALDHAVVAQWAYLTPDGTRRLHKRMQQQHRKGWDDLSAAGIGDEIREAVAAMPAADSSQDWPNFWRGILVPIDSGGFLGSMYTVLSQLVHPSHAVYDLLHDENGQIVLNHEETDERWEFLTIYAVAASCMFARWILARLLGDEEELARLDGLSDALQIPVRLDHQLAREDRRFPEET